MIVSLVDKITVKITREMIVSLVDKITVSEEKEIKIYYKFSILNEEKDIDGKIYITGNNINEFEEVTNISLRIARESSCYFSHYIVQYYARRY